MDIEKAKRAALRAAREAALDLLTKDNPDFDHTRTQVYVSVEVTVEMTREQTGILGRS